MVFYIHERQLGSFVEKKQDDPFTEIPFIPDPNLARSVMVPKE